MKCEACGGIVLFDESGLGACKHCGKNYMQNKDQIIDLGCKICAGNIVLLDDKSKGTCEKCGMNYLIVEGEKIPLKCNDCGGTIDFGGNCLYCGKVYDLSEYIQAKLEPERQK